MDAKDIKIVFDWKNILTAVGFTLGIATVLVLVIVGGVKLWGSVVKSNVKGDNISSSDTNMESQDLKIEDIIVGAGEEATKGDTVTVHYTGILTDGTKFDSSLDRGEPFSFTIGNSEVIEGWDIGVNGMKKGGKRRLVIPPRLAYGDQGAGSDIPPNSTLVFEIELLDVKKAVEASE